MKSYFLKLVITLWMSLLFLLHGHGLSAQTATQCTPQVFYDALSPYGNWIYEERYGYVWIPVVSTDFHPYYTNGYWEMTIYGNTWVSLYPWGWATFHYGRWTYDPFYGWIWIPGYVWAPAWVCWRYGGGFYGWAPLGPQFIIYIGFGNYVCPGNWWVFTPDHYVYGPRHSTHYYLNTNEERIRNSTIVVRTGKDEETHTLYPVGPSPEEIKQHTGTQVSIREISEVSSGGQALPDETSVRLYRPRFAKPEAAIQDKPLKFENAPRPIKDGQPVDPIRTTVPGYKKEIMDITPDNTRNKTDDRQIRPVQPQITKPQEPRQQPDNKRIPQTRPQNAEPVKQTPIRTKPLAPVSRPAAPQPKPIKQQDRRR